MFVEPGAKANGAHYHNFPIPFIKWIFGAVTVGFVGESSPKISQAFRVVYVATGK